MTTATAHLTDDKGTLHQAKATITPTGHIQLDLKAIPNGSYNLSLIVFGVLVEDPKE